MDQLERIQELLKTIKSVKKEMNNLENSISGTSKVEDLDYVETDFDELKGQILILEEEIEELNEIALEEEFQAMQIYQEPVSCETYGIGSWQ